MTISPTPWRVSHDESDAMTFNGQKPTAVLDANGLAVACNTTYYPVALDPDNANIIAAAPDLLEALEVFAELLGWEDPISSDDKVTVTSGPTTDYSVEGRHILAARAAIAKARGETA